MDYNNFRCVLGLTMTFTQGTYDPVADWKPSTGEIYEARNLQFKISPACFAQKEHDRFRKNLISPFDKC